jgi:hypothetical protein
MSKILTLAQIAIDTGKAISAGVASHHRYHSQQPRSHCHDGCHGACKYSDGYLNCEFSQFATGGIVDGHGKKECMDQVTVRVNDGEMILNEQQQANMHKQLTGKPGAFTKGDQKSCLAGKRNHYPEKSDSIQ